MTGQQFDADAMLWDARFALIRLDGGGCRSFLHGQTSARVEGSADGDLIQACWLNATGRVQALLEIRLDAAGADVLILSGDADRVANGFERVIFPADRVRLGQPRQQRRVQRLKAGIVPDPGDVRWLDERADLPASWAGAAPADAEALERWRLRQGWPLGEHELTGDTNPFELGLAHWIELDKGCYLGQETVAKLASRGGVKQQLRCWTSTAAEATTLRVGDQLSLSGQRAGVITGVAPEASTAGCFGLALVRRQALDAKALQAGSEDVTISLKRPDAFCAPPTPS